MMVTCRIICHGVPGGIEYVVHVCRLLLTKLQCRFAVYAVLSLPGRLFGFTSALNGTRPFASTLRLDSEHYGVEMVAEKTSETER